MTHLPTSPHPHPRSPRFNVLTTLAVATSLALFGALGIGCLVGEELQRDGDDALFAELPEVDCSGLDEWAQGTFYPEGTEVTDTGDVFAARVTHTAFGVDWNPKNAASLWVAVAVCADGAGGGGGGGGGGGNDGDGDNQDPPPPPPDDAQDPPPPAPAECSADGAPGPLFDPAGDKNVGNGVGGQFIFGQCLSDADCGSGCCAGPCGICSGPAVGDVPPKTGCGFPF